MRVADVMRKEVGVCRIEADLETVAELMRDLECGALPVIDDRARPMGIVRDRDILMAALASGRALGSIPATSAMCSPIATCSLGASLQDAELAMCAARAARVLVLNAAGRLVGIVSLGDIARAKIALDDASLASTAHALAVVTACPDELGPGANGAALRWLRRAVSRRS